MFRVDTVTDGVVALRMDDGKVNVIGPAFLDAFDKAWPDAAAATSADQDGPAVLVLTGNQKAFSAGLDLRRVPELDREGLSEFFHRFNAMTRSLALHDAPVVAAVDGPAIAGGAVLALACDVRVGGPGTRIGVPEVLVGIPLPPPTLALAHLALPADELQVAVLSGVLREGRDARQAGWLHVYEEDRVVVEVATELAALLAQASPAAYAYTKEGLREPVRTAFDDFTGQAFEAYIDLLDNGPTREQVRTWFARATGR